MNKKKVFLWLGIALVLLLGAALLWYRGGRYFYLAYPLLAAAGIIVIDVFRKNWAILSGLFAAAGLALRFLFRGYAYWGYIAIGIAALIAAHRFFSRTLWRALIVLICIGVIYFCIVEVPIVKNSVTDQDPERDYLIVLGAAVHGDNPSLTLVRRLEGALDYLNQYPDSVAIVSGGKGAGENITEAQAMHDWLIANGIPEERILMEDKATSTMENLEYSFAIIRERGDKPEDNVAIVSSAYHLYRAKLMSRNLGVEAAGVAAPWGYFFVMLNYFIREAFGVTHLWVFGY